MRIATILLVCVMAGGCAIVRVEHNVTVTVDNCNADIKGLEK